MPQSSQRINSKLGHVVAEGGHDNCCCHCFSGVPFVESYKEKGNECASCTTCYNINLVRSIMLKH